MFSSNYYLIIFLSFILLSCNRPVPIDSCMENSEYGEKLFVFVGQKIELKELASSGFLCRYKILEKICGKYELDTIEFLAYDSLGIPAFEKYKTVLLYVIKSTDGYEDFHKISLLVI